MLRLTRLTLTDFRNYASLLWRPQARISVLLGANGAGKTNLLEAVSLLAPGRGLRGARREALARLAGSGRWAVAGRFLGGGGGEVEVATGLAPENPHRRAFRNETEARIPILWLTPQMDRLFSDSAAGRRAFLDRLVFALEPQHARAVAAHDRMVASRNRLLAGPRFDAAWLAGIEDEIARHAVAVVASRAHWAAALNGALADAESGFPAAVIEVGCEIGARLARSPALAVEDWVRGALLARRRDDALSGRTSVGAHRADMAMRERATGTPAAMASTGQQKTLLLGVVLGHAALVEAALGAAPILLLDEAMAHLDAARRASLAASVRRLGSQVMLTGTDAAPYRAFGAEADTYVVEDGAVRVA